MNNIFNFAAPPHRRTAAPPHRRTAAPPHRRTAAPLSFLFLMMLSFFHPLSLRSQTCNFPVQCRDVCCDSNLYEVALPQPHENFARVSVLIQQGRLLPMTGTPNNATNTLQRIEISVPLWVDVPYTFFTGSELVFLTNAANLDVQDTLTLRGTHLHGCGVVWDGAYVRDSAVLYAYNNCIEDGLRAIRLLDGARYEITGNSFQRNYTSIFAGSPDLLPASGSNLWQLGQGISNNDISGLAPLVETIQGATHPRYGIVSNWVNEMAVGLAGANPKSSNAIHDFGATATPGVSSGNAIGILSTNSNLTVDNTYFYNIGMNTHSAGGTAIDAGSTGLQYALTVTGLGGLQASAFTFNNCEIGIKSQDNILSVKHCRFDRGAEHVRMNFPAFPHWFTITDNYFEQYQDFGVSANAGVYRNGTIERNTFEDDSPELAQLNTNIHARRSVNAIGVISQPSAATNFLRIRYNQFFDRQKNFPPNSLQWGSIGVVLHNMRHVADVDDNDFTQEHVNPEPYSYQGVWLVGSAFNQIRYNTVTGLVNNPTPDDPIFPLGLAAIDVTESGNNTFRCNILSNVRDGLRFAGLGCNGSTIHGNSMTSHNQNLRLKAGTVVGQQPKRWNTWPGGAGLWEANNESDQFLWSLSQFRIQFPETLGNVYWPQPRNPPVVWFITVPGPGTIEDYCSRDNDGGEKVLTTSDELVLANQYPAYKGYTATQWEAAYLLYDRLYNWPELRTTGSASETFYTAQSSTNISKLHNAIEQYGAIGAVPSSIEATLDANYTQTDNTLTQIAGKRAEMAAATSASEQAQILQDLQALSAQLQTLTTDKAALSATHLSERNNKIAALQTYLAAITTTNTPEQNLKSVLTMLADAMAANTGDTYTAAQTSTLEGVAAQCRYAGGYGVVLARIALKKNLATYNDEAMCPPVGGAQGGSEDRNQAPDLLATALSLSPNPAANTLEVGLPSAAFSKGQLQVLDILGSQVRSLTLQPGNNTATIDLSGLPDGNYLLEVVLDGQRLPGQRFVKHSQ